MANNLSVKITADIVDLQTKFGIARAEANALGSEFRKLAAEAALGKLDASGAAQLSRVSEDMLLAKQKASDLASQLDRTRVSSTGLGGAIEEMRGKISSAFAFTGLTAAVAAISEITSKVVELGERATEIRTMSDLLGMTAAQYQSMAAAADESAISSELMVRVSERLVGLLQKARDGNGQAIEKLKELGITNAQIASSTFGVNDAIAVLHARLTDASTATLEQARLIEDLGTRGGKAIEVLKRYGGSQEEVAGKMREVNGITDAQAKSASDAYASFRVFGSYISNTFTKVIAAMVDTQRQAVAQQSSFLKTLFSTPASSPALQSTVPSIAPQVQSDAASAKEALQTIEVTAHAVTKADLDALRDTVDSYKSGTAERLAAMRSLAAAAKDFYPTDHADKYREIVRQLSAEERAFADARVRGEEEATRAAQKSLQIREHLIKEQLDESKRDLEEMQSVERADAESAITIGRMRLQAQLSELDSEVSEHRISAAEKYSIAQGLVRQLAELDKQTLDNELLTLLPGTAAYERAANQKKQIEARLDLDLAALKRKYNSESDAAARQEVTIWKRAVDEIESAEGTLFSDLISRRRSLGQSIVAIGAQFIQQEIANDAKAVTTRLLMKSSEQAQERALEQGGFLYHLLFQTEKTKADVTQGSARNAAALSASTTQEAIQASAAATSKSIQVTAGISQILSDAAVGAAGASASVAAIPWVGWAMAPGVGAATYADIASYASLAALEVGTTYVPRTGLYTLHEGEAVAPVPFARGLREGGGALAQALAGTGGGSLSTVHQYGGGNTINVSDTSMRRMLQDRRNQRELAKTLGAMYRGGARP